MNTRIMGDTRFQLSIKLRKRGAALLDQQLWCMGRDLFHAQGNALFRVGMTCHRVPDRKSGGHGYSQQIDASSQVVVWGFGVFYGVDARGGIFMRRHEFSPVWSPQASLALPIWKVDQLPSAAAPRGTAQIADALWLVDHAITWLIDYETWVVRELGEHHRASTLKAWHAKPACPGPAMCDAWRELRDDVLRPEANRAAPTRSRALLAA